MQKDVNLMLTQTEYALLLVVLEYYADKNKWDLVAGVPTPSPRRAQRALDFVAKRGA